MNLNNPDDYHQETHNKNFINIKFILERWRFFLRIKKYYCAERIIKDNMKLWVDMTSIWVEDNSNTTWIICTEPNKYPEMRPWLIFWELMTSLNSGKQDLDGSTLHVKILELVMGGFSSNEEILREIFLLVGIMILNIGCITSIHWPQFWINAIYPVSRQVKRHSADHLRNGGYWPLIDPILIMCIGATIMNVFIMLTNVTNKMICSEYTVTSEISINHNTTSQAYCIIVF